MSYKIMILAFFLIVGGFLLVLAVGADGNKVGKFSKTRLFIISVIFLIIPLIFK